MSGRIVPASSAITCFGAAGYQEAAANWYNSTHRATPHQQWVSFLHAIKDSQLNP